MIEIPSSKEEKKINFSKFLTVPLCRMVRNLRWVPPLPSSPQEAKGKREGEGERIEIIAKMLLVMIFQY